MIFDHTKVQYRNRWNIAGKNKYNGAYYYSIEIVKNIIPNVETDRNWMTVNIPRMGVDHSIVFVHNNLKAENYEWLRMFNDLVLVCGIPETCEKLKHLSKTIYLPLSVDVKAVEQHRKEEKTKKVAFAGRPAKRKMGDLPEGIDFIEGIPRGQMLDRMADYEQIYAVGRTAIEAKILGCEVLPYDERFPDVDRWEVLDNLEAAKILQTELDKIDRPELVAEEPQKEVVEVPQEPEQDPVEEEASSVPEITMDNTKKDMLAFCKDHGIKGVTDKMTKADILQKIQEATA